MKGFTHIKNIMLDESQLSIPARYLYCVLVRYCGKNDTCYPSQKTLARVLGVSDRHIRELLDELKRNELLASHRSGFNKPNTYTVAKDLRVDRNQSSAHVGSMFPLHRGTEVPANSTYRKGKANKGMQSMREALEKRGIIRKTGVYIQKESM